MTDRPIRPEDIKPGDWVRFDKISVAIVGERMEYSNGEPSNYFKVLGAPWFVSFSDVLEVRRG